MPRFGQAEARIRSIRGS